jgi:small subunit ribosomal protein S8
MVCFLASRKLVGKERISMSMDSVGDFLTIIRNGIRVSRRFVVAPHSKFKQNIAQILQDEGFIRNFEVLDESGGKKSLKVYLKYVDGESVIHEIIKVSTPGRRVYRKAKDLEHVVGKLGISIVTTNKGVITDKQARESSVGGEVICSIW